jgi:hypothetical protein
MFKKMKDKIQPKVNRASLTCFDKLLNAVLKKHGEIDISGQIFPINSNKSGIIFSSDGKPVQGFTVDANGKVKEATIKKR